jgi:hypothetical protein
LISVFHRSREDWLAAKDMRRLAEWMRDGQVVDMFQWQEPPSPRP